MSETTRVGYVVGVDAGGTSLRVAVATLDGQELARVTGAADPDGGPETLTALVRAAMAEAGADAGETVAVGAGITKVSRAGVRDAWVDALADLFPHVPAERRTVVPDFVTAFHGALPDGVGLMVIAGTGSVVYGEDVNGGTARVGGRGWEYGDEGSGAFLTTEAVRRTLRALDGLEKPSPLTDAVCAELGTTDAAQLGQAARDRATVEGRGFLVPLILRLARAGDAGAVNLFVGAAGWLAAYVRAASERLNLTTPVMVATVGGLWEAGDLLTEPFETVLRRWLPDATVRPPDADPTVGAVRLASRTAPSYTGRRE